MTVRLDDLTADEVRIMRRILDNVLSRLPKVIPKISPQRLALDDVFSDSQRRRRQTQIMTFEELVAGSSGEDPE